MCVRLATETLDRVDLLDGLVAIAIDEVKCKAGHRYLTVVCDHVSGRVVWAAKARSIDVVGRFFDLLGDRSAVLQFVTAHGATWITDVVAVRAPDAIVCLDTFHVIGWATNAPDKVRGPSGTGCAAPAPRPLRRSSGAAVLAAPQLGEPDRRPERCDPRLETANRRTFRAWQLKEQLRDISPSRC